jgi:hypothetical protein
VASIPRRQPKRLTKPQHRARKTCPARTARAARRQPRASPDRLPRPARELFAARAGAFTRPTFLRFVVLARAALRTTGGRTACNRLRTRGARAPGQPTSYHRRFARRRWSSGRLARALAGWVCTPLVPPGPSARAGDATVAEHPGKEVYGTGCHRDPVRPTPAFTAFRWGHKGVVLAVLVRFPCARRRWALPLLVARYRPEALDQRQGRRHQTPPPRLRQRLRGLVRWSPARQFVAAADGTYAPPDLARRAARRPDRLTFVSHFYPDAPLPAPPPAPARGKKRPGRPPQRGAKRPGPAAVVKASAARPRLKVSGYGGGRRAVAVVTGTGRWDQAGEGRVPVRWVFVEDGTGTHRDEYVFSPDVALGPAAVLETYTGRWDRETTVAELRADAGLGTTRGWCRKTGLRVAPCRFGLDTVVALLYARLPRGYAAVRVVDWPGTADVTVSDALTAVRRRLWVEGVFAIPGHREACRKRGRPFRAILLYALAPAA